jgi:cytosine/adenosine deaminase-related metal-dependent hydrolase
MAIALRARVVFPVDRPAIENGVVTIDCERIVAVGAKPQAADVTDLGDVALLPGFVNCHTHLEFSYLQRPLGSPGMRLIDWIRLVIAERGRHGADLGSSFVKGFAESLRCGVTSIGDIVQGFMVGGAAGAAELMLVTRLLEVIGFSVARAESAFTAARERLDELSTRCRAKIGLSPHAPYTVSPALLQMLVDLAIKRGLPVAMHLAESAEELELLDSGTGPFQELLEERSMWDAGAIPRGSRPFDYLRMLSKAPRALVIHGNYLQDDEQAYLALNRDRMSLIYCPRTHAYFAHSPYPLGELRRKNVRVALGTDSRASNPDLDLLAEMRHVACTFPEIDPAIVLRMGTLDGAEALGRETEVGSITPGKLANLAAVPLSECRNTPSDVLGELFAGDNAPCDVWVRGTRLTS